MLHQPSLGLWPCVSMEVRLLLLPLRRIVHCVRLAGLIEQRLALLFTMLRLFVLLHKIARPATASAQTVLAAVASQVVLRSHVATVH